MESTQHTTIVNASASAADTIRSGKAETQEIITPGSYHWLTLQNLNDDYFNALNIEDAIAKLNADSDTIVNTTQADIITKQLISTIHKRLNPETRQVLPETQLRTQPFIHQQKDWIIPVVLLTLIMIGFLKKTVPNYISTLFQSVVSDTKWNHISETLNLQNRKPGRILFFVYHITLPLVVYEYLASQGISLMNYPNLTLFALVILAALLLYLLRFFGYWILGYIFETTNEMSQFLQASLIFTNIMGILLLPFGLLMPFINPEYYPLLFKLSASLFIIMYLYHILRGAKIILNSFLSLFYMFLYLCALEIVPVIWLYKLLVG